MVKSHRLQKMSPFTRVICWALPATLLFVAAFITMYPFIPEIRSGYNTKHYTITQQPMQVFQTILDFEDMSPEGDAVWNTKLSIPDVSGKIF
jgi:hypothetical protein